MRGVKPLGKDIIKPGLVAVFLLTSLILTNAIFIRSVSGNKGSLTNSDFAYSGSGNDAPSSFGYLIKPEPNSPQTTLLTIKNEDPLELMPGAISAPNPRSNQFKEIEDLLILPNPGFNWGEIHSENAVDIANYCDAPVFSSYAGKVVTDNYYGSGQEGWNGGYGLFVLLEHPGGLKTRYAHLEKAIVQTGDLVKQGDLIGYVGATGNTHGITGCHLHFEVLGGVNPFGR